MKTTIIPPPEQEPRVTLDLSVDEFVALYGLLFTGGSGNTPLRAALEQGFYQVKKDNARTIVGKAMVEVETGTREHLFYRVDKALKRARAS
jgi:hypothetical protein